MPFTMPGRSAIPTPSNDQTSSKALKRRSLLPQLLRASIVDDTNEESRGVDGDISDTTNGSIDGGHYDAASRIGRSTSTAQSRMRRPLSMRIPATAAPRVTGQTKASRWSDDQQASTEGNAPMITIDRTSIDSAHTRKVAVNGILDPPQHTSAVQRSGSVRGAQYHTRSGSTLGGIAITSSASSSFRSHAASPSSPAKADRSKAEISLQSKPAFNTYQQHFSPAKTAPPKPPIPIAKAPHSTTTTATTTTEDITLDIARQQIELFQLSLMHEQACANLTAREQAARSRLREMHQRLRKSLGQIIGEELERERQVNLVAMSLWQSDQSYLMNRLRILQKIHQEAFAMSQEGSGFANTVAKFRAWTTTAAMLVRENGLGFVTGLSEDWRHAHASAALRVRSLQRELAALPAAPRPSSVSSLMASCETLLDGMLRELDIMNQIERELLRQDRARIDEAVAALPNDTNNRAMLWTPRWQRVS